MDRIQKNVEHQIRWMCIGFALASVINLIVSVFLRLSYLPLFYIISALIYFACSLFTKLCRFVPIYLLCWMLVALQSCLTVYVLGDDCGIQMYLLALIIPSSYIRFTNVSPRVQHFFQPAACCLCVVGYLISDEVIDYFLNPMTKIDNRAEFFFTLLNVTGSLTLLSTISGIFVRNYQNLFLKLLHQSNQMEEAAEQDTLTGLKNRRGLEHLLVETGFAWEQEELPITVALGDVDHFKNFNDTYGHDAGDAVLRHLGSLIVEELPPEVSAFRWGGEEFLFLLPMSSEKSVVYLEQLRIAVEKSVVPWKNRELKFSITIGVSEQGTVNNLKQLIQAADQALYRGKEMGRNTVVME